MKQREAIEAAKREHELELARLGQGRNDTERAEVREDRAKAPKLPSFVDGKDDLDAYLQRFERFATTAKWEKTGWASKLNSSVKLHQYTEGMLTYNDLRGSQLQLNGRRQDGLRNLILLSSCTNTLKACLPTTI